MEQVKEKVKSTLDSKWKETKWTVFIEIVSKWLVVDKNEDEDDVVEALVGLISYGATTEEKLQNVADDKKGFADRLSPKGVPDAICDLLFEQYVAKSQGTKRRGSDVEVSSTKRVCITQERVNSMDFFLGDFSSGDEKQIDDKAVIEFSRSLLGMSEYPPILFIRECYKQLYGVVHSILEGDLEIKRIVLMGTPGIGKTVFGVYVAFKLIQERRTVLYFHGGSGKYYLLGPAGSPVLDAARKQGFVIPPPEGVYVGLLLLPPTHLRNQGLVHFLEEQEELYYVHDPPKEGIRIREDIRCKILVVSSPHRGAQNDLKNLALKLYMPPWTLKELHEANECLGSGQSNSRLSEDVLRERWDKYGGVARWVLKQNDEIGANLLREAFGMMSWSHIEELLDPFGDKSGLKKDHSGLTVHMHPSEDFKSFTTKLATRAIFEEIRSKFQLHTNQAVLAWAKRVSKLTSIGVGTIMEQCWHNQLGFGEDVVGCTIRELTNSTIVTDADMRNARRTVTIPKFTRVVTFARDDMRDLERINLGEYCLPETPNFPKVDSLAVLKQPFCDLLNTNECLVGFQMTVSESGHDLGLDGGRLIRQNQGAFGDDQAPQPFEHVHCVCNNQRGRAFFQVQAGMEN